MSLTSCAIHLYHTFLACSFSRVAIYPNSRELFFKYYASRACIHYNVCPVFYPLNQNSVIFLLDLRVDHFSPFRLHLKLHSKQEMYDVYMQIAFNVTDEND